MKSAIVPSDNRVILSETVEYKRNGTLRGNKENESNKYLVIGYCMMTQMQQYNYHIVIQL